MLINVYVFIFLMGESIAPCAWCGGGARRESRRKNERSDLNRLWAQSRCNKIQVDTVQSLAANKETTRTAKIELRYAQKSAVS